MTEWQEWIERYVRQVARRLPKGARADVAGELRSLLTDEVEERIAAAPARTAEELALERIAAFGDPAAVARRYSPVEGYLIGPALYPAFPVLDPNYRIFLPWLDAWIVAGILHDAWLMGRQFKDPLANALEAAIDAFGGILALRIVADGPFTVLDVAFKPVIAIVAVIILVSAAADAVGAVRMARDSHLAGPDASRA